MNYTEIRRLLLKVFIGFLSLTALVAIVSVLSHKFGETQLKVLLTTFSITAGSICAMSCAAFLERQGGNGAGNGVGFAGILAASVAVLLAIVGVWGELKEPGFWKTTVTCIVVAVAFAHACLLRLPNLGASHRWMQTVSTILIGFLGVQISLAVWGEIRDDLYYRFMAVVSVLVVLMTLVIPICTRLGAPAAEAPEALAHVAQRGDPLPEQLVLRQVAGAVFADPAGRRYRVTEIQAEAGVPPKGGSAAPPGNSGVAEQPSSVSCRL